MVHPADKYPMFVGTIFQSRPFLLPCVGGAKRGQAKKQGGVTRGFGFTELDDTRERRELSRELRHR